MSKVNNFLNTLSLLTTILILSLCYWARTNLPSYVSTFNYFSLTALAATIFILPDFICSYFPSDIKWYRTSEFYTGFLVLFLGIGGIILSPYAAWIGFIILPIGTILAFWQFYQFARYQKFLMLIMGLAFMVFMILIFYSQDCNSMLFPEKIILGKAHIDTLYHITLSNMFSTLGDTSLHSSGKAKFRGGGPGLGLFISKGIIEAHGGNIWAESPGYDEALCPGSTFHIVIPMQSALSDDRIANKMNNG